MLSPLESRIAELVALPSVSSVDSRFDQSNRRVVETIANWAENIGFSVAIEELPNATDKFNLVATMGRGEGGLVLAGHSDTVPWDEGKWSSDPFALTERDDTLVGLGTSDMKAFFAIALEAASRFNADKLRAPLILIATADEESTMGGARALVAASRVKARHAVVGEPTSMRPMRTHKGALMHNLKITGRSGHSSDPSLGNNAIDGAQRVMAGLIAWRESLARSFRNDIFAVPFPTLNFGAIHGGDSPNRICGECEIRFDLRPLPGMDLDALRTTVLQIIRDALTPLNLQFEMTGRHEGTPPFETKATAHIVRVATELSGADAGAVGFGTEAPYFTALGMETLVMGPGEISSAHQPDEFLRRDAIEPATKFFERLISSLAG